MGNYNDAVINFTKAIELDAKALNAYYNRAVAKYSLHDIKGAADDCDKVLQFNPDDEKALNLKAKIEQGL
jgi:tetratricopeptide (TPR) repeat protein